MKVKCEICNNIIDESLLVTLRHIHYTSDGCKVTQSIKICRSYDRMITKKIKGGKEWHII